MFGWFFGKKEVKRVERETKKGFEAVKKDLNDVGEWIKYFSSQKNFQKDEINEIKEILSSMQEEIESLKNMVSILGNLKLSKRGKGFRQLSNKQTAVQAVSTAVQTAVQTPNLEQFSITERAIIWVLLNTDMKLSYDDLATMLGKERSTIRSQVNLIKQKSSVLLEESVEKSGKKRVYIPNNIKEKLLKKVKVKVHKEERGKKGGEE